MAAAVEERRQRRNNMLASIGNVDDADRQVALGMVNFLAQAVDAIPAEENNMDMTSMFSTMGKDGAVAIEAVWNVARVRQSMDLFQDIQSNLTTMQTSIQNMPHDTACEKVLEFITVFKDRIVQVYQSTKTVFGSSVNPDACIQQMQTDTQQNPLQALENMKSTVQNMQTNWLESRVLMRGTLTFINTGMVWFELYNTMRALRRSSEAVRQVQGQLTVIESNLNDAATKINKAFIEYQQSERLSYPLTSIANDLRTISVQIRHCREILQNHEKQVKDLKLRHQAGFFCSMVSTVTSTAEAFTIGGQLSFWYKAISYTIPVLHGANTAGHAYCWKECSDMLDVIDTMLTNIANLQTRLDDEIQRFQDNLKRMGEVPED